MDTLLLFVRHAQTDDNVGSRLSGWTDSALSALGESQTLYLAEHFQRSHEVAALYSSTLTRALRTAEAIGRLIGEVPRQREDLREMHFGRFEGWPLERVEAEHPEILKAEDDLAREFAWPEGESRQTFRGRVRSAIDDISRAHAGQSVAIVTHGGVISYFLTILHNQSVVNWRDWYVPNASLSEVVWDPDLGRGTLVRHGFDDHLAPLRAVAAP
ncbi:MAG: histidine phosphatase family protein [Chloroflexota bacterium]|nr:MAG: histidine phosphatase family protein [Chloroflexota bacterium]